MQSVVTWCWEPPHDMFSNEHIAGGGWGIPRRKLGAVGGDLAEVLGGRLEDMLMRLSGHKPTKQRWFVESSTQGRHSWEDASWSGVHVLGR